MFTITIYETVKASVTAREAAQRYGLAVSRSGMACCIFHDLTKRITNLLDNMRIECYTPDLPIHRDRIHVPNGTLFLNGSFTSDKEYCRNRLPVAYNSAASQPERWLFFLSELLEPEDVPTLQEFMGYCLIPATKGQKMLMLVGPC